MPETNGTVKDLTLNRKASQDEDKGEMIRCPVSRERTRLKVRAATA